MILNGFKNFEIDLIDVPSVSLRAPNRLPYTLLQRAVVKLAKLVRTALAVGSMTVRQLGPVVFSSSSALPALLNLRICIDR